MLDRGTEWLDCQPVLDMSAGEAYRALEDFAGPKAVVRSFYSDNSPALIKGREGPGLDPRCNPRQTGYQWCCGKGGPFRPGRDSHCLGECRDAAAILDARLPPMVLLP